MSEASRYRVEDGSPCVDVKVNHIDQLFDSRDPAPFRARDLDSNLDEYLRDASEDLAAHPGFRVVFWFREPCPPGELEQAFRAHFEDALERIRRQRRRHRRAGQVSLLLGILLIIAMLSLAQLLLTLALALGSLGAALREGLVILMWVVLWRPVEVLIYDWIPVRHERKIVSRLLEAKIDIRVGEGPAVPLAPPAAP